MQQAIIKTDYQKRQFIEWLVHLSITRPLVFTWKAWTKKRSRDANALLHVWLEQIAKHQVFDDARKQMDKKQVAEYVKEKLKEKYLGNETVEYVDQRTGEVVTITRLRRTRDLDSGEFCYFLERVQDWALHGLGMVLTSDKEDEYNKWQEQQAA